MLLPRISFNDSFTSVHIWRKVHLGWYFYYIHGHSCLLNMIITFWNQQTNRSSKTPIQTILCMKTSVKSRKANVFWSVFHSTPFVPFCIKLSTKSSSLPMWGCRLLFSFQWNMCPPVALFLTSDSPHFGVLLSQTPCHLNFEGQHFPAPPPQYYWWHCVNQLSLMLCRCNNSFSHNTCVFSSLILLPVRDDVNKYS